MKDILPAEMAVRDYVIRLIKETYSTFGFSSIETPCVEHIENLSSKQGGENEKLIFKILKRGEKLKLDTAECEADLVDGGLRYDLTVPLSRYYANHANELPPRILLVAWRKKARGTCSFSIPDPLSVIRIKEIPPSPTSTVTALAPASMAFSTSSFTTDAGRSTTSPAAILSIVFWSRTVICRCMIPSK